MLTKKKVHVAALRVLLLTAALAGCKPAGPSALLDGKQLIEKGKYNAAIDRLKVATALMETNALAWNYLGLAYHHANQSANAIDAYQRALKRNPDLVEVHYDLGCVLLEENRPETLDAARSEFTAYIMRRPKSAEGWLKLGAVQLRLGELGEAERSFNEVRRIDPQNAEALNDTGVVLLRRNQTREAAAYFESALRQRPEYPAALLNLATILQTHLNNRKLALEKYREYLALNPRPANWEAVSVTAKDLEEQLNPPQPHPSPPTNVARAQTNATTRIVANVPKQEQTPKPVAPAPKPKPAPEPEVVQVSPTPTIKVADSRPPPTNESPQPPVDLPGPLLTERVVASPSSNSDETSKPQKRSFFQKINPMNLFRSEPKDEDIPAPERVSPGLPGPAISATNQAANTESPPVRPAPSPKPMKLPRYPYKSPSKPAQGNRQEANRLLAQGIQAYRDHRLTDALAAYRAAVGADPSSFEAQSDLGLAAFSSGDLPEALSAYEVALAINPVSFNARFNFALALKKAGYIQDAALELERLLAISSASETPEHLAMAHLALGNLYSEEFHQPEAARPHYQKVLELDPQNSQATAIRYWLRDNS